MQTPRIVGSELKERVYQIVRKESPQGITSSQISIRLGKSRGRVRQILHELHGDGHIVNKPADFEPNGAKVSWLVRYG